MGVEIHHDGLKPTNFVTQEPLDDPIGRKTRGFLMLHSQIANRNLPLPGGG